MSAPAITSPVTGYAMFIGNVLFSWWSAVPWVMVFLFTQMVGVRLYVYKDKEICLRIQKRLTRTSHVSDGGKGYGYSVGLWYLASVVIDRSDYGERYDVWMIASTASHDKLTSVSSDCSAASASSNSSGSSAAEGQKDNEVAKKAITVYDRSGPFHALWFKKRTISLPTLTPRTDQSVVLDAICAHQTKRGHTVVYLHGPAGSGKSMIGVMLAHRLGAIYCNTLKPWQPGDTLAELYAEAEPTPEKPLVLAFDEFDCALLAIHAVIPPHKLVPTAVPDKSGWNRFFDEIDRGMFPNIVLVLTSNRDPAFIRAIDPSYIREGRVGLTFSVGGEGLKID